MHIHWDEVEHNPADDFAVSDKVWLRAVPRLEFEAHRRAELEAERKAIKIADIAFHQVDRAGKRVVELLVEHGVSLNEIDAKLDGGLELVPVPMAGVGSNPAPVAPNDYRPARIERHQNGAAATTLMMVLEGPST